MVMLCAKLAAVCPTKLGTFALTNKHVFSSSSDCNGFMLHGVGGGVHMLISDICLALLMPTIDTQVVVFTF